MVRVKEISYPMEFVVESTCVVIKFVNNLRFSLTPVYSTNKTERHDIKHPSPKILALINVVVTFKLYGFELKRFLTPWSL
jgi:hypothetical protein